MDTPRNDLTYCFMGLDRVQSSLVPKEKEDSYLMSDRIIQYLYIKFSNISTAGNIPYFTLEYTEQEAFLMEETDKNVPSMKLSYCLVENDIKKDKKERRPFHL